MGEKCGMFEIDWQTWGDDSMISIALETQMVAVVDTNQIPVLCSGPSELA